MGVFSNGLGTAGVVFLIIGIILLLIALIMVMTQKYVGFNYPWYVWAAIVLGLIGIIGGAIMIYMGNKKYHELHPEEQKLRENVKVLE